MIIEELRKPVAPRADPLPKSVRHVPSLVECTCLQTVMRLLIWGARNNRR